MKEIVECPICLEIQRNIKVLSCGHNICSDCYDKLLKSKKKGKTWYQFASYTVYCTGYFLDSKCPVCQSEIPIDRIIPKCCALSNVSNEILPKLKMLKRRDKWKLKEKGQWIEMPINWPLNLMKKEKKQDQQLK